MNKWFENFIDNTSFLSHTRIGYTLRRKKWIGTDTKVDLRGKMCMVTGACTGLGLAAAEGLGETGRFTLCSRYRRRTARYDPGWAKGLRLVGYIPAR